MENKKSTLNRYFFRFVVASALFISFNSTGQDTLMNWVQKMQDPSVNFYDVIQHFEACWNIRPMMKAKGYKQFKRSQDYLEPRIYPSGDVTLVAQTAGNFMEWEKTVKNSVQKSLHGKWKCLGPTSKPGLSSSTGTGRVNFVRFHPTNSSVFFVGTPNGGLWKTTDAGASWTTNTDLLGTLGSGDLAIDPTNPQTMYLATGDRDASDSWSLGVLKTTDGGQTWLETGLKFIPGQGRKLKRLLINPNNPQILIAVSNVGIYRTSDAGTTWTNVYTSSFDDAEFKPGDPSVVYATGNSTYGCIKSTDGGATWTSLTVPFTGVNRSQMDVSPANPNCIYIITVDSDGKFNSFMRSTNGGATFTVQSSTPNIMGYDQGTDSGGQGWYNLSIAASPVNENTVTIGGVNTWQSTDGGVTWAMKTHWYGGFSKPFVHADCHELIYAKSNSSMLFSCNDGGIFRSNDNGTTWVDITSNLAIAQQYRIGNSATNPQLIIAGHQDNGTNLFASSGWGTISGGDGMDCFIDRTNDNVKYYSYVNGTYYRNISGAQTTITGTLPQGEWVSPWHQSYNAPNTIYAGGRPALYRSTNQGTTWTQLGTPQGAGAIKEFAIAPSDPQVIYAVKKNAISRSTDGGTTWTNITGTLPIQNAFTSVAVHNINPDQIWITISGFTASNKVFKSKDGGATWINISAGLPNVPCNVVAYQNGSVGNAIYIGMDIGVYYLDDTQAGWVNFFQDLPKVSVRDLELFYPTGKIRAATFGRGTWESDLYSIPTLTAGFTFDSNALCSGKQVAFTNQSVGDSLTYQWTFSGNAFPSTSTLKDPVVTFPAGGTYTVVLTISKSPNETETVSQTITVKQHPDVTFGMLSDVCINTPPFALTGGEPQGGVYSGLGITSSPQFNPLAAGAGVIYLTYTYEDKFKCSDSAVQTIVVGCLDVLEINPEPLQISPNPTSGTLSIDTKGTQVHEIIVYDLSGEELVSFDKIVNNKIINLDLSRLKSGIYEIQIRTKSDVITEKIVVAH